MRPSIQNDPEFRKLRGRVAGLERANKGLRTKLRDEVERTAGLVARLGEVRAGTGDVQPEIAALRADLMHAVDCCSPDCERCETIDRKLTDTRPTYATVAEVSRALAGGRLLRDVGIVVLSTHRDTGVGSAYRRQIALVTLRDVIEGGEVGPHIERRLLDLGLEVSP